MAPVIRRPNPWSDREPWRIGSDVSQHGTIQALLAAAAASGTELMAGGYGRPEPRLSAMLSVVDGSQLRRRLTTIASGLGIGIDHVDSVAAALAHIGSYCYD